jgi:hypothetical protein
MHAGTDYGSPMPRDEALAENPPVGALIDYYLKSPASAPVKLEILDPEGRVVRQYSSDDKMSPVKPETLEFPASWRPAREPLSTAAGMHRWIWDLHYAPVATGNRFGEDDFGFAPSGVTALPGAYTVKLTAAGHSYSQPLTVKMDPRIETSAADLRKQFQAAVEVSHWQSEVHDSQRGVRQLLSQARQLRSQVKNNAALLAGLDTLVEKAQDIAGTTQNRFAPSNSPKPPKQQPDLASLGVKFAQIFSAVDNGDAAPTAEAMQALAAAQTNLAMVMEKWTALTTKDLPTVNTQLKQSGLAPIVIGSNGPETVEKESGDSDTN